MTTTTTTIEFRRLSRLIAGAGNSTPVKVIDGTAAPTLLGSTFCWTTKGGTRISNPNAYSKKGWSNMVYYPSTIRVEVGRDWAPTPAGAVELAEGGQLDAARVVATVL